MFYRQGGNQGEVETSVLGTVRLQSDHLVSYQGSPIYQAQF